MSCNNCHLYTSANNYLPLTVYANTAFTARLRRAATVAFCLLGAAALSAGFSLARAAQVADASSDAPDSQAKALVMQIGADKARICLDGPRVLHVQLLPAGVTDVPTLVLDPHTTVACPAAAGTGDTGGTSMVSSNRLVAAVHQATGTLDLMDARLHPILQLDLKALASGYVSIEHPANQPLYGVGSYTIHQSTAAGLLQDGEEVAKAGEQGYAGAPFVWSTAGYGVLVDSDGAAFHLEGSNIRIDGLSKLTIDLYLIVGRPPEIFVALANISGHSPLFPKWSMGFLNSQLGINEGELIHIIDTYRNKHIPIDAFILDFDWKAWGDDNYGEFRWNPVKFPDGQSGKFAKVMMAHGVHLVGIMKPRIHVDTVEGRYATKYGLWIPGSGVFLDYWSHKPVKELNFDNKATRQWYGHNAMKYGFDTGLSGWWNDEADDTGDNTQFLNMQRSLYNAQRAGSKLRVWSINRNFWLGSQRYAYGMWSGDINTGFGVMARQRARMLSAIDVGEMWWGMDTGGFRGRPSDENYARWIEFDAFVPIFRVHGTLGQRRQPWLYGRLAQKAAARAIRLRYRLIPYIYSYAWSDHVAGVGVVRPLTFGWPNDPKVRNDVSSWMFGKWLLVSPIVKQGQTEKRIYLPPGTWTNWFTGRRYRGGASITLKVDSKTWMDIPLFIRQGAIIPMQPVMQYVGQRAVETITLNVFPSNDKSHFVYYDDDGETYTYEHGDYYLQRMGMVRSKDGDVSFEIASPQGSYVPPLRYYLVKVQGIAAASVDGGGRQYASPRALMNSSNLGWAVGRDHYGEVTWVRVAARSPHELRLRTRR